MILWFLKRGYLEIVVEKELGKVKFSESSRRTNKRDKGARLVATYHPLYQNIGRIFIDTYSRGSDVLNFIGSDQKVAPYNLVVFKVMTPKNDFLLIGAGTITPKGFMNTANLGKTSLFVE